MLGHHHPQMHSIGHGEDSGDPSAFNTPSDMLVIPHPDDYDVAPDGFTLPPSPTDNPPKRRRISATYESRSSRFQPPPGHEDGSNRFGGDDLPSGRVLRARPPRQLEAPSEPIGRPHRDRHRTNQSRSGSLKPSSSIGDIPSRSMRSRDRAVNYCEETADDLDEEEAYFRRHRSRSSRIETARRPESDALERKDSRPNSASSSKSRQQPKKPDYDPAVLVDAVTGGRRLTRNMVHGISADPELKPIAEVLKTQLDNGVSYNTTTTPERRPSQNGATRGVSTETTPNADVQTESASTPGTTTLKRISRRLPARPKQEDLQDTVSSPIAEDSVEGGEANGTVGDGARDETAAEGSADGDANADPPNDPDSDSDQPFGRRRLRKRGVSDDDEDEEYKVEEEEDEEDDDDGNEREVFAEELDSDENPARADIRDFVISSDESDRHRTPKNRRSLRKLSKSHKRSARAEEELSNDDWAESARSLRPRRKATYLAEPQDRAAVIDARAAAEEERRRAASNRRARAERRSARFGPPELTSDLADPENKIGAETEGDGASTTSRRLRPRRQQIDYTRQLHPGAGWVGQPLEALAAEKEAEKRRGKSGKANAYDARSHDGTPRRRFGVDDDGPLGYRPGRGSGRFSRHQVDSDDDEEVIGRRRPGSASAGQSRSAGLDPINIMELLKAQEQSLLKDLPEEEREKFSNESRLYRSSGGKGLADVDPLAVGGVTFDSIGGLEDHIRSLKEMVVMPLLYPEIFSSFNISAPRGVLFYGPPGTGKTLMARALATSCSTSSQKVAFFMRKGADVLSKWVGESERQLRLLFEEAKTYQPSIIFFDEIDGLAPVRSSKQDQIHASIVSTLLALMDGLDNRGQVVVIGATNRIDAIDPALRRPGRFDREFFFPLPPEPARRRIIEITTSRWNPPLSEPLLEELAKATRGYGGADVKALCTEAALNAVRRCYPEIYDSTHKLLINTQDILVTKEDFMTSMKKIIPSTERSAVTHAKPLPSHVQPLVSRAYNQLLSSLDVLCPILTRAAEAQVPIITSTHDRPNPLSSFISPFIYSQSMQPRILICGEPGMGQRFLGPAALHVFESKKFHIQSLDLATILNESGRTAEAALIQIVNEVRRHRPAVLYIPNLDVWWSSLPDAAHSVFLNLLSLDSSVPFVLLASCESPFEEIDPDLQKLVCGSIGLQGKLEKMEGWRRLIVSRPPSESDREKFFDGLLEAVRQPPLELVAAPRTAPRTEPLQRAPSPPPRKLTDAETDALLEHEANLRRQLRMELRFILNDIKRVKRFSDFHRPVDPDAYPDYYLIVTQPMDLETMLWKVNNDEYSVVDEFVEDFERIVRSAEEFNQAGSAIIAKALDLFDTCMLYINTLKKREPEFVWELKQAAFRCRLLNEQRKREGLPELGKRGRRARQPETDVEDSPPKPVAEGKRSSQRLRGEKPDLSTEDARLLENVRAARSSTPKEADTDSGAIGNSTPIRVSTKPFLDDRAMEVDSDVGPTASPSNEDGPATPLVPTAISPVNHRNQILSVESLLAPSPTSASSFPPVEMPGQPILPTPPNSIDSEALPIFASSSKALPSTAPSRPSSSSSAQRTQQMDEPREVSFDQSAIDAIRRELVEETRGKSVAEVEALGVAVAGVIIRNSANWDRRPMIKEIASVLERSRGLW